MPMTTLGGRISTEIEYPSEDGQLIAESNFQRQYLTYSIELLDIHFQNEADVYVSGNLFIYYEQGNPKAVVFGVAKRQRMSYKLWEEGIPDFILEITSKATLSEDQGVKKGLYAFLGVREYFQYDPTGDYLEPQLKEQRLAGDNYWLISPTVLADESISLFNELQLELRLQAGKLRIYNPVTGEKLLTHREAISAIAVTCC